MRPRSFAGCSACKGAVPSAASPIGGLALNVARGTALSPPQREVTCGPGAPVSNWNIETAERVYAAFAKREFPHDLFDDDSSWHTDPDLPRPLAYHGRDEVATYFEHWIDPWIALGAKPVELIRGRANGSSPSSRWARAIRATSRTCPSCATAASSAYASTATRTRRSRRRPSAIRRAAPTQPSRPRLDRRARSAAADETVSDFVAGLDPAREALDLGCGDARLTAALRAEHLTAADISLVALKRARRRLPNATLVLIEPAERLPFEDEAFDLVLCADTLQEIQDVAHTVAEMKRVLRPGGTLALTAPAYGRLSGWSVLRHGFREQFDPRAPALRFLTPRSLGDLLDLAGFHPIEIERAEGRLLATAHR